MRADVRVGTAQRRSVLVAGTAAVALSVGCGKWGAYIGAPPIYLTDVLLVGGCCLMLLSRMACPRQVMPPAAFRFWPGGVLVALACYVLLRFALGRDHSLTAVRDFAPYGYVLVAFLSALSYANATPRDRMRTAWVIRHALLFHLVWTAGVHVFPSLPGGAPLVDPVQGLHMFSLRGATDATVTGITAAVFLMRFFRGGGVRHLVVAAVATWVVVDTEARAALIATVVALGLTLALFVCSGSAQTDRCGRVVMACLLPVLLCSCLAALPHTAAGSKLLAGFGLAQPRSPVELAGIHTVEGRREAWQRTVDYLESEGRTTLGVGFGPDYLYDSGARAPLGGSPLLRSPHNYVVNTWARLGLVGLGLLFALFLVVARESVRVRALAAQDELLFFVTVFPAAFLTNALFGVELEAPFGAVPFFWCLGIILCRPRNPSQRREHTDADGGGAPDLSQPQGTHPAVPGLTARTAAAGSPDRRGHG